MGLFERIVDNVISEIRYKNLDNPIGKSISNYELNKHVQKYDINNKKREESPYDRERKAEKISGDANYILGMTEYKMIKETEKIKKEISDVRKFEMEIYKNVFGGVLNSNYVVGSADKQLIVAIERPKFYSNYNTDAFTISGLFKYSIAEADEEADKAMVAAEIKKAKAREIERYVDMTIKQFDAVRASIENEIVILNKLKSVSNSVDNDKIALKNSLKGLMESAIADGNFSILEHHNQILSSLEKVCRR